MCLWIIIAGNWADSILDAKKILCLRYFKLVYLECVKINLMVWVLIISTEKIDFLVASHPEGTGGNITHAAVTNRNKALPIYARLAVRTDSAINTFDHSTFANEADILTESCVQSTDLRGSLTHAAVDSLERAAFLSSAYILAEAGILPADLGRTCANPAINPLKHSAFLASADIIAEAGILPADLGRTCARPARNTLKRPAFLAGANVLTETGIQPADLCSTHAGPTAISADRVRTALAAGAVGYAGAAGGIATAIVADQAVVRAVAAVFPVEAAVVVDSAGKYECASALRGALDGTFVLADDRAAGLALLDVADFIVNRAVGAAYPTEAPLLAQCADLDDRAGATGVALFIAGV